MKIAIFGATGSTGKVVVQEALKRGFKLKALVRSPEKLGADLKGKMEIVKGQVEDQEAVKKTIKETDAVISVLGHTRNSAENMQILGAKHMLAAMESFGVRRIVTLTGSGVPAPGDKPRLLDNLLTFVIKTADPARFWDGIEHTKIITGTDFDWTIVRTPRHTNAPRASKIYIGKLGEKGMGLSIPRENIAAFMLDVLEQKSFIRQLPVISA